MATARWPSPLLWMIFSMSPTIVAFFNTLSERLTVPSFRKELRADKDIFGAVDRGSAGFFLIAIAIENYSGVSLSPFGQGKVKLAAGIDKLD